MIPLEIPAEIFAILTSIFFAIADVVVKKGFKYTSPLAGAVIVSSVVVVILWMFSILIVPTELYFSRGVPIFLAIGLFVPGCTRWFNYIGIDKMGASRAVPIASISPLVSAISAVILLKERLTPAIITGTFLIVSGVVLITHNPNNHKEYKKIDLVFPFIVAFLRGSSNVFHKIGMGILRQALLAGTLVNTSGLTMLVIQIIYRKQKVSFILNRKSLKWFFLAGLALSGAFISHFNAINIGDVVVVSPLVNLSPLFVVLMSYYFLRDVEKINLKIFIGAFMIVMGVLFTTVLRNLYIS